MVIRPGNPPCPRLALEPLLDPVPDLQVDDRRMKAVVDLPFVAQPSGIDRVRRDPVEVATRAMTSASSRTLGVAPANASRASRVRPLARHRRLGRRPFSSNALVSTRRASSRFTASRNRSRRKHALSVACRAATTSVTVGSSARTRARLAASGMLPPLLLNDFIHDRREFRRREGAQRLRANEAELPDAHRQRGH